MKLLFSLALLLIFIPASSQPENKAVMQQSDTAQSTSMLGDIHAVSPALELPRGSKEHLDPVSVTALTTYSWHFQGNKRAEQGAAISAFSACAR